MSKKMTTRGGMYLTPYRTATGGPTYQFFETHGSGPAPETVLDEYFLVKEVTIKWEMPDGLDERALMVKGLETKIRSVEAESTKTVTQLRRQINELLAIEG